MYIVAIETSTPQASVALASEDGVIAQARLIRPRRHAEFCMPALEFCLVEAGIAMPQVAGIAVGLGPGLFTGMRVGLATARGLARAARIPMVGMSSLDILAYAVRLTPRTIVSVIDARRGEVYFAFYRPVPAGVQRLAEYKVSPPEVIAAEIAARGEPVLLVGDGAHVHREVFEERGVTEFGDSGYRYPSAAALADLAIARFEREEFSRPEELAPIYLRRPDAEINWSRVVGV